MLRASRRKRSLTAWVVRKRIGEHLDRHVAIQGCLVAFVDHTHAAATEFGDDVVMSQLLLHDPLQGAVRLLTMGKS